MSRPVSPIPPVHIEDLASPTFSPEVLEMMAMAAPFADELELRVDAICDQAMAEASTEARPLTDFGGTAFRDPMAALLTAYTTDTELSPMGHIMIHAMFTQLARNRLLVTDLLERHPEIHDIEIVAPIIIAGLPRTGTTHLHNLLSADPALRSLPYWESMEPVPMLTDVVATDGGDPRRDRCAVGVEFMNSAIPYFKRMHEMTVDHVHEEIQLLAIDFSSMLFETLAPIPSWRERFLATDQTPHYDYLKTVLKVMTFLRGGERWVLKSPQHLEQYRALMSVFPDAVVIVTHRDPVAVTASMATMLAYTSRMQLREVDPVAIGRSWMERLHIMLGTAMRERDLLPADQSMDVDFIDFMADDVATVESIYALAGQPLDDRARTAHAAYLDHHQRDRHGGLIYDLGDFAIDPDECRAGFSAYIDRFVEK